MRSCFIISGTGHRTSDSFDKAGGSPARLTVSYTSPSPLYTITQPVNSSANDAEQSASGPVSLNSTDLELVNDNAQAAGDQTIGVRFENLALPPGSVIASANIQFSADETQSEATALTLRAQAADNAGSLPHECQQHLRSRPSAAASVNWAPGPPGTPSANVARSTTPILSALVREIVGRPGWSSGNAMAFLISGSWAIELRKPPTSRAVRLPPLL